MQQTNFSFADPRFRHDANMYQGPPQPLTHTNYHQSNPQIHSEFGLHTGYNGYPYPHAQPQLPFPNLQQSPTTHPFGHPQVGMMNQWRSPAPMKRRRSGVQYNPIPLRRHRADNSNRQRNNNSNPHLDEQQQSSRARRDCVFLVWLNVFDTSMTGLDFCVCTSVFTVDTARSRRYHEFG